MRGLVIDKNGNASIEQMPMPEYGAYECLVKMISGGLCGTDMKILHNNLKGFSDYPTVLGHEGYAEVVAVGDKVKNFVPGDKVTMPFINGKIGDFYSTWGAFAEYATITDLYAMQADGMEITNDAGFAQLKVPDGFDDVAASMITTFREVYSTMKRQGFQKGQSIVIYGAGPVGLTFISFAKIMGLSPVISVDLSDEKIAQAKALGADMVFNSSKCDLPAELKKIFPQGVDILLDAAGVPALINQNLKLVKDFGKVCVYGVTPKNEAHIDWSQAPYNFHLSFSQWPSKREEGAVHDEIISLMQEGKLDGMDYISDVFSFGDALKAMELFVSGKFMKKIAIRF